MSFSTVHPALQSALAHRGYTTATPVQAAVLAPEAAGRDLLVSAQTGSGKTVAFGLGIAKPMLGEAERFGKPGAPLALVVAPTRELAQQVHRELAWLYADTGARITACVGGFDPRREHHALAQGVHVVVGTPGRLCDHLARGALSLARIQAVVLDEADEMLDMGFREDLERLLDATPATRRTLLFSATIPKDIAALAKRYQQQALRIATQGESDRHRDIEYHAIPIVPRERDLAVVNLLRYHDAPGALVFCATRDGVTHLAANLGERGFSVAALSGELSQRERNVALQALRDGRARVCVATDVAARGLDLPDLGLVIHADLPQNAQALVHRSGRTGRAGRRGVAIVLVPDAARRHVERMLQTAHVDASWSRGPTADEILARDRERLVREIGTLAEELSEDDRVVARTLLAATPAEDLVATLVRLRREARPAPEELTLPPSMRPREPEPRHTARPLQRPRQPGPREHRNGDAAPRREHADAAPRREHAGAGPRREHQDGGAAWFTINVGRSKNADPKWLIPLLCRRGNITKREIGKIQILARETRVEIAPDAAPSFAEAVRRPDPKDKNIHIEPLDAGA
jgi:ATP-dependent RNA helicase DeaD